MLTGGIFKLLKALYPLFSEIFLGTPEERKKSRLVIRRIRFVIMIVFIVLAGTWAILAARAFNLVGRGLMLEKEKETLESQVELLHRDHQVLREENGKLVAVIDLAQFQIKDLQEKLLRCTIPSETVTAKQVTPTARKAKKKN